MQQLMFVNCDDLMSVVVGLIGLFLPLGLLAYVLILTINFDLI